MANEMLANCTLAGQEGTLEYLAATAALQQWGQSALALLVLHQAQQPLTLHQLEQQAETLLESEFQVLIRQCAELMLLACTLCARCCIISGGL